MTAPARSHRRRVIWDHLAANPGLTVIEIARAALGKRGPTTASLHDGSIRALLLRMEADGQVTRTRTRRPGQCGEVSLWYAVPGAFPEDGHG